MNKRRILFRIAAILVLIGVCALMMVIGRGHSIYLDNKALTWEGQTIAAPYKITVYVDGEQVAKLYEDERGQATCMGQNFEMTLEVMQTKGGPEETVTIQVKLPWGADGIIVNMNGAMADLPEEAYLEEFVPVVVAPSDDEEVVIPSEDAIGGDF